MKTIFALLLAALPLHAQLLITDFVGGNDLSVGPGSAGYEFTTGSTSLTLRSLGIWASSDTLFNAHTVGVWDAASSQPQLIRSVSIDPSNAVKVGAFWFANIAPLTLLSGHEYVIAASYLDNDFDFARGNITTINSSVAIGDPLLSSGTGFEFPDIAVPGAALGFLGPNMSLAAVVPEPAACGFAVGLALIGFMLVRRRGFFAPCVAVMTMASMFGASPPVTIRDVLDAKRNDQKRLLLQLAKQRPLAAEILTPAANRPPVTPGNENGNRPVVPPGLAKNYATP